MASRVCRLLPLVAALLLAGCAAQQSGHDHAHADYPGATPTVYPDRVALTWSDDPAHTLSVTWRTSPAAGEPMAQIAPATGAPSFYTRADTVEAVTTIIGPGAAERQRVRAAYHTATFAGLAADSLYAYRVGDGEYWSEWYQAETAADGPEPVSFLYVGDAQNNVRSHWSRLIREAYATAPDVDFALHAGDLVNYAHRNVEWGEWFGAGDWIHSTMPLLAVPGNHEYNRLAENGKRRLAVQWRPQFAFPENGVEGLDETNYVLDVQGVRIVALNSNRKIEPQAAWLDSVLTAETGRWTVATFHHPVFSSSEGRNNPELREAWRPILEKHQVDLVLQGHDHTYARGRSRNVAQGANVRDPVAGTVYVNSVSGPKMYRLKARRWEGFDGVSMDRGGENTQLFQVVRAGRDTLTYRSYTATGERYDAFDLVRRPDGPNRFLPRMPPGTAERTHETTLPYARPEDRP
jgi:predicted phosphodiesterase